MPSPVAHSAVGYIIYRFSRFHGRSKQGNRNLLTLLAVIGLSLLPDLDSVAGILLNNFGKYHNNGSHSLFVGFFVALVIAMAISLIRKNLALDWFVVSLLSYGLHVIMDFFTVGRGVMFFWPFSLQRYTSPLPLFYGFHWSDGIFSSNHLITLLTELGFILILFGVANLITSKKTPKSTSYSFIIGKDNQ